MKRTILRLAFAVTATACLAFSLNSAKAGQLVQTVNFSDLSAVSPCGPFLCTHNTSGGFGTTGPVEAIFFDFPFVAASAGLSGVLLTSVTWHLRGILRAEFSNPQFPDGQSWNGILEADFPWAELNLPGAGTIPRFAFRILAPFSCSSGLPCLVEGELPFDVTVQATDFTHYFLTFTVVGLDVNITPDFGGSPPLVIPNPFWGLATASFAGNTNTLTLTYGFIPEPPTLTLLSLILGGLALARRRT